MRYRLLKYMSRVIQRHYHLLGVIYHNIVPGGASNSIVMLEQRVPHPSLAQTGREAALY